MKRSVKILSAFVVSLILFSPLSHGDDPSALKEKADTNAVTAAQLMQRAFVIVENNKSIEARQTAISLLAQAGQMFESAASIYKALAPDYAAPQDYQNALQAMQQCVQNIERLKRA